LPAPCSPGASSGACANTRLSGEAGKLSGGEAGFLLVFLLPFLLLLSVSLAASLKVAWSSQGKIALQSRLDVCALRMAMARKQTLQKLVRTNQALALTVTGIYLARGVKIAGPVGAAVGSVSEAAMLRMNSVLATAQESLIAVATGKELAHMRCDQSFYSKEEAHCWPFPPIKTALRRESTLFPDVRGTLTHQKKGEELALFRCQRGRNAAAIELRGDSRLMKENLEDAYAE
jgi:hypothetical protein